MMRKVLVAGTFDPPTLGHKDIIWQCSGIFDEVCVCIFNNIEKHPMYPTEDRLRMLEALCAPYGNVRVDYNEGTVAEYARKNGITYTARGLRSSADCDYELLMATVNKTNNPALNTVLFPCINGHAGISSTAARSVIKSGGNLVGLLDETTIAIINKINGK